MLGSDRIVMGPTSDLGPIDPQFQLANGSLASAKAIIAAVEDAEQRVQENPQTYPLHASLLNEITGLLVQQAKDAIGRTDALLAEALACADGRDEDRVAELAATLREPLIEGAQSHGATIPARYALELGLPVEEPPVSGTQWRSIWRLWAKYFDLRSQYVYEGQTASQIG